MDSLRKQKGFTILELLIVIVIIGILVTLGGITFTGVQKKTRDRKRQNDINNITIHLEAFNASNGYYPSFADLHNSTWVKNNLKGLDPSALVDPKNGSIVTGTGNATHYGYKVTQSDGTTSCETDDTMCASFTLTATLESGGMFTKSSNT